MDFRHKKNIEIRALTDNWGPFPFDFSDAIPEGDTISSVTVTGYAGKVMPDDATIVAAAMAFVGVTEIPLIDTDYTPVISGAEVSIKLCYPGDAYKGQATIVFLVELTGTGVYPFFYHGVRVK